VNTRTLACCIGALAAVSLGGAAEPKKPAKSPVERYQAQRIDLSSALRLAGAQNLDVQLAVEQTALARAAHLQAEELFFPWIAVGGNYVGHQGNIQEVNGPLITAQKTALSAAGAIKLQTDLGDALFKTLATRQLVKAAVYNSDAELQDAVETAALAYFDLVQAQAFVGVAAEAVHISENYEEQLHRAVDAGIAFAGDAYRIQTETEHNRVLHRQAMENLRVAAAFLAQVLHLDPAINLLPEEGTPSILKILSGSDPLESFVQRALSDRPELFATASQREAARRTLAGAKYGPLLPTIGAQYYYGGLGGGTGNDTGNFSQTSDYGVGISWRIGPGGLFDIGRIAAETSRLHTTELTGDKLRDEITRQVVASYTRLHSLSDQIEMARRELVAAQKALEISQQRVAFGVSEVIERIQAEQELTRARREYLGTVAEYDKAQFTLRWAIGTKPQNAAAQPSQTNSRHRNFSK